MSVARLKAFPMNASDSSFICSWMVKTISYKQFKEIIFTEASGGFYSPSRRTERVRSILNLANALVESNSKVVLQDPSLFK